MMKKLFLLIFIFLFLISCTKKERKPDISNISLNIKINRLEKDLFLENIENIADSLDVIKKKYGVFFDLFTSGIIRIGHSNSPEFINNIKSFVTDYTVYQAYESTIATYPDINDLEKQLTKAFKYYKYYFPEKPIPAIFTYISGFNESIIVGDTFLAIGLDKYLGRDSKFYKLLMVPEYLITNMHKDMIISDCIKAWALTEYPYSDSVNNLISNSIYNGKIHYFQKCMLPDAPDSIIMGYTKEQIEWCIKNEKKMWEYLIEQKLIYDKSLSSINNFTKDGPFTKDFGRKSPGRAVNWLGWQIIKAYMKKNIEISLKELMNENDYQKILLKAKYRP